uniref:Acylphosphatase n=1 Tax=Amphimedon queenslandica TaxID=400682 RepID=A0A1X7U0S9_AMPQE
MSFVKVSFEVFGRVQGVFFRKGTQKVCEQNKVCGWVKNTPQGTVVGVIEGDKEAIAIM